VNVVLLVSCSVFALAGLAAPHAHALTLKEAVAATIDSNPQINQAKENREAIEFELRQGRGLYLPRLDAEASAGTRRLERPIGQTLTPERDFSPAEGGLVATWKLFDGGHRAAEVDRQASRVDGASFRVLERSEFLALEAVREYLECLLQAQVIRFSQQNINFLQGTLGRIRENVRSGALTDADLRQGEERMAAARARLIDAQQQMEVARIRFLRIVGLPFASPSTPRAMASRIPASMDAALGLAVKNNPRIHMANADIDAAHALVRQANSRLYPEFFLEGRARTGWDIDGISGRTNDLQARGVMRWNLFNGGIDEANIQEQTRRVAEAIAARDQVLREVRETVELSYFRRQRQRQLAMALTEQNASSNSVVSAYNEQFLVGRRSLLDLLEAQNNRYNVQILLETARISALLEEFRILAATGQLVASLGLKPPSQAEAYARAEANVPPTADAETLPRYSPPRGKPWLTYQPAR
jgi:adhesin transport system outer membrane protein